jgi:hypothetical protein
MRIQIGLIVKGVMKLLTPIDISSFKRFCDNLFLLEMSKQKIKDARKAP